MWEIWFGDELVAVVYSESQAASYAEQGYEVRAWS